MKVKCKFEKRKTKFNWEKERRKEDENIRKIGRQIDRQIERIEQNRIGHGEAVVLCVLYSEAVQQIDKILIIGHSI